MSDIISWVNGFSIDEQRHALDCIYDQHLLDWDLTTQLAWAAQWDRNVQSYLHHLADCNFDKTLAVLKWRE